MPVTLGASGITYSDATTQTTKGSVLSALQGSAYQATTFGGFQGFSTGEVYTYAAFNIFGVFSNNNMGPANTSVFCGFGIYRSGTTNDDGAGIADVGVLQFRMLYRSIS
jgi:hypothetical protein